MTSSLNYMDLCRLCLVKEQVAFPIFDGEDDVRQIFIKISTCLPVKVSKEDRLPKKICSNCVYRVENSFEFWNTTASAEKQLLEWLEENCNERKVAPSAILSSTNQETVMEAEQLVLKEETLEQDQSASSKNASRVGAIQTEEGAKTVEGGGSDEEEEEVESEDGEEAMGNDSEESGEEDVEEPANKEEVESEDEEEDEPYEELEPTTFVNVSLACDEAGPSGAQQTEGSEQKQQQQSRTKADSAAATSVCGSEEPSTSTAAPSTSGALPLEISRQLPWMLSKGTFISFPTIPNVPHFVSLNGKSNSKSLNLPLHSGMTSGITPQQFLNLSLQMSALARQYPESTYLKPSDKQSKSKVVSPESCKTFPSSNPSAHQGIDKRNSTETTPVQSVNQSDPTKPDSRNVSETVENSTEISVALDSHNSPGEKLVLVDKGNSTPCNLCGLEFKTNIGLQVHMTKIHNVHGIHTCKLCNKSFKYLNKLCLHMKSHDKPKDFVCDICGYASAQLCNLKSHRMRHFREFKFKCDICNQGFYYVSALKQHQLQHSKDHRYVCKVCPLSWKTSSRLSVHMRTHHPELYKDQQFFECEACGEKFVMKQLLSKHKRRRHSQDLCPNLCDVCGKSFASPTSLRYHKMSHRGEKPETCDVCGKCFLARKYLRLHVRTHTNEKPYMCDQCGKSFTQRSSIVIHTRYHTGERPYECSVCGRCFVSRSVLNQHQKSSHSVEHWTEGHRVSNYSPK